MSGSPASQLCTACGMCCDGTLFSFVALSSEEARKLRLVGAEVRDEGGLLKLPQRCGALVGTSCAIYDERPFVCRRFDCLLVRALTDKELPLDEALEVVAEARARVNRLAGLLPKGRAGEPTGPVLRAAKLAQGGVHVSDSARAAFDEAQEHLRRHFVPD